MNSKNTDTIRVSYECKRKLLKALRLKQEYSEKRGSLKIVSLKSVLSDLTEHLDKLEYWKSNEEL